MGTTLLEDEKRRRRGRVPWRGVVVPGTRIFVRQSAFYACIALGCLGLLLLVLAFGGEEEGRAGMGGIGSVIRNAEVIESRMQNAVVEEVRKIDHVAVEWGTSVVASALKNKAVADGRLGEEKEGETHATNKGGESARGNIRVRGPDGLSKGGEAAGIGNDESLPAYETLLKGTVEMDEWKGPVASSAASFDPFRQEELPRAPSCNPVEPSLPTRQLSMIISDAESFPTNCERYGELCALLREHAINREVMTAVANSAAPGVYTFLQRIKDLGISNFILIALDAQITERVHEMGIPYYYKPSDTKGNHKVSAMKFGLLQEFIEVGCSVLLTDTDVVYLKNPMNALYRDSDVEGMSDGWDHRSLHGYADAVDDAKSADYTRRTMAMRIGCFNSGLWYISATHHSLNFLAVMKHRLETEELWDQTGYNMELSLFGRDSHFGPGATFRVMSPWCFMNSKVFYRRMLSTSWFLDHTPVGIHVNYHSDKQRKMREIEAFYDSGRLPANVPPCRGEGCSPGTLSMEILEAAVQERLNANIIGGQDSRLARQAAAKGCPVHAPWNSKIKLLRHHLNDLGAAAVGKQQCSELLCTKAYSLSADSDLSVTFAEKNHVKALKQTLKLNAKAFGNVLVLAKNSAVCSNLEEMDVECFLLPHKMTKFSALQQLISAGIHVLYFAPGTIFLSNPFTHLYRDSDVEVMSNGFDDVSAYGYDHVVDDEVMGWSRYVHGTRVMSRSPDLMYLRSTQDTLRLLDRMNERLGAAYTPTDEQISWNLELFLPSLGAYSAPGVIVRTMNYLCWTSARVYKSQQLYSKNDVVPVALVCHGCEAELVDAIAAHYDEPTAATASRLQTAFQPAILKHQHCKGANLELGGKRDDGLSGTSWLWGGAGTIKLDRDGTVSTPWGNGKWGWLDGRKDFAFMDFANAKHLINVDGKSLTSHRCGDGAEVLASKLDS